MDFFIPGLKENVDPLEEWKRIKDNVEKITGWSITNNKIFNIRYTHDGNEYFAEIGKNHPRENEPVMVIFEFSVSNGGYLICTLHRGMTTLPIIVGNNDVISTKEF